MRLEVWNTVAAVGTFLVVVATAVAALIQLRHLRVNNQLQALLAILSMPYEPVLNEAFDFVLGGFSACMRDPEFRAELVGAIPPARQRHKQFRVCDYYERLGSCIKFKLISEDLYFDNSSPERFWTILEPAIALYRTARGPTAYENFEYLVIRSREWDRRHPSGNLPRNNRSTQPPELDAAQRGQPVARDAPTTRKGFMTSPVRDCAFMRTGIVRRKSATVPGSARGRVHATTDDSLRLRLDRSDPHTHFDRPSLPELLACF